jgi:hypothetical protein
MGSAGLVLVVALFLAAPAALAQDNLPPAGADNCLACHEDLYYLHDTGKWHCLCDATPGCRHCHGGQPGTLAEAEAHGGMIANPLQENAAVCQQCHCDDCQKHVDQFLAVAGGTVTGGRGRTFPTQSAAPTNPPPGSSGFQWPSRLLAPWRLAGLGVVGVGLAALGVYGARCYRADWLKRAIP